MHTESEELVVGKLVKLFEEIQYKIFVKATAKHKRRRNFNQGRGEGNEADFTY